MLIQSRLPSVPHYKDSSLVPRMSTFHKYYLGLAEKAGQKPEHFSGPHPSVISNHNIISTCHMASFSASLFNCLEVQSKTYRKKEIWYTNTLTDINWSRNLFLNNNKNVMMLLSSRDGFVVLPHQGSTKQSWVKCTMSCDKQTQELSPWSLIDLFCFAFSVQLLKHLIIATGGREREEKSRWHTCIWWQAGGRREGGRESERKDVSSLPRQVEKAEHEREEK